MKAILIEKNGTRHEIEIEDTAHTAGAVLRIDMRMRPPLRVFRYAPERKIVTTPTFVEVDFVEIDAVPGEKRS